MQSMGASNITCMHTLLGYLFGGQGVVIIQLSMTLLPGQHMQSGTAEQISRFLTSSLTQPEPAINA